MKVIYFDTSAYVKLFSQEPGSATANSLFGLAHDGRIQIYMSYWTINETCAALDRKHRNKELNDEQYRIVSATISKNLMLQGYSNVGLIMLANVIVKNSIDVINTYHVSADDALHLYTAYILKCDHFLCQDKKLINKTDGAISSMKVSNITDEPAMTVLMKELES